MKLYTFNISHFSEKARWALDYEGIPYEEKILLPGPHRLVTRRMAPRTQVPVLEHEGRYVQGSSAILDYVADRLGGTRLTAADPAARAKAHELEKTLDQVFGRGVQQVLYSALLKDRRTVIGLWSSGGPRWARGFYALAFPVVATAVKRMYKTTDVEGVTRAKAALRDDFRRARCGPCEAAVFRRRRTESPRHHGGGAARAGVSCPGHRVKWPSMPAELADFEARLRGRPTWNHVMHMYRDHRKPDRPAHLGA